jgi:heme-degrading monooxygenase HmoA
VAHTTPSVAHRVANARSGVHGDDDPFVTAAMTAHRCQERFATTTIGMEENMAVKIMIKRKFKEEALKDAEAMLMKARTNAMGHKGYISTETLVNFEDPQSVIIISMWQSKEDWDNYRYSGARQEHEQKYRDLFEGTTQYEIFKLGM